MAEHMQDASILADKLRARGFQVVQNLKGAGHATIFRVKETEDPSADAYVAKVVSLTGLDAKGRASAQQEVSLLKGLAAHPNLIAYRESFMEEADLLYMVMSLAEDGDLRRVVTESQAAKRMIPEPIVLSWMRQTLSGLEHLHGQGVVHRDLKSSNIFLCEGRRRIRIGDFGISRILESTAFASSCVGTPAYMSPELMRNERYDYHVDMWALGCICFELCTLNLPFTARSLFELACQVMEQSPAWSLWSGYSEDLQSVAQRLLNKGVAARPTAAELLQEPLFAPGGRGSLEPPAEAWAALEPMPDGGSRSPEKRISQPPMSQLTTAVTKDSLSSNSGNWTMTPRKPWENASRGSDSVDSASPGGAVSSSDADPFARELQRAREAEQKVFSKEEFAHLLSTHSEQFLKDYEALEPSAAEAQSRGWMGPSTKSTSLLSEPPAASGNTLAGCTAPPLRLR
eukprot:CAMPEP_0179164670 /NCGR_PEP_ID=MMETSP0796-20121207/80840_1 /TAXON_ID=73915 /ORGANISM="Pyrodinium bahamense, Strain pbaha01" /LENGTH=456 /DNA_ID=CAMNT_0020867169 /DNA_START=46 /DNA_END=1414 /DNA_ORIENTATION=+